MRVRILVMAITAEKYLVVVGTNTARILQQRMYHDASDVAHD